MITILAFASFNSDSGTYPAEVAWVSSDLKRGWRARTGRGAADVLIRLNSSFSAESVILLAPDSPPFGLKLLADACGIPAEFEALPFRQMAVEKFRGDGLVVETTHHALYRMAIEAAGLREDRPLDDAIACALILQVGAAASCRTRKQAEQLVMEAAIAARDLLARFEG